MSITTTTRNNGGQLARLASGSGVVRMVKMVLVMVLMVVCSL